ncbi:hypothetical protein [Blastococcus montanus]|uniref:hypothetical protein n=1 Tax=Blastococcus montanus TaxID=3144973 RepID=UPI00320A1DDE
MTSPGPVGPMDPPGGADAVLLREAADRLDLLADRTTPGDWRLDGLLASRPEVVAHAPDGGTEHVAEARARSGAWIAALSSALAGPLAAWLRAAADGPAHPAAVEVARHLVARLP